MAEAVLVVNPAEPWLDRQSPGEARAKVALAEMTLDEKLAMLSGRFGPMMRRECPGEMRIGAGFVPGVPRLGIPDLWETDASLGVANPGRMRPGDEATALPSSLALAASFDPELAHASGAMIGAEARAKGFNVLLAGGANLIRDPWCGRAFEYLSEDPLLTGVMAGESVRGVQSNGIISTIKHLALNAQESGRHVVDARIADAELRESDLLAFEIAIERGQPGAVMGAYNKLNGEWTCESHYLLTEVLKDDWGFDGWVMSDWGSVHSTEQAALAGLDQQSGREFDDAHHFGEPLRQAVIDGRVPETVIDEKVLRILLKMFEHGLVDDPAPEVPQPIDFQANAVVAQRVAEAGMVLMKNDGGALPVGADVKRIAVIGGHADIGVLSGGGSSQVASVGGNPLEVPLEGAGPFNRLTTRCYHSSSPLKAIRQRAPDAAVSFCTGEDVPEAIAAARDADLAIVFGEEWRTEVLDAEAMSLSVDQEELIEAVAAANPRTIVVLQTGGAIFMPWQDQVSGVIQAWYPGQRGGEAITRVLFGDVDPSGRLPVTFPASREHMPRSEIPGLVEAKAAFERVAKAERHQLAELGLAGGMERFAIEYVEGADTGYRWYARNGHSPAFPFGHGLSYTTFEYCGLTIEGETASVAVVEVANTGNRQGVEVVQVYAIPDDGIPRLVGFQRVGLEAGEWRAVQVPLDLRPAQIWDEAARARKYPAGPINIAVGRSATDLRLIAKHELTRREDATA